VPGAGTALDAHHRVEKRQLGRMFFYATPKEKLRLGDDAALPPERFVY
jgi:hypothetical protein